MNYSKAETYIAEIEAKIKSECNLNHSDGECHECSRRVSGVLLKLMFKKLNRVYHSRLSNNAYVMDARNDTAMKAFSSIAFEIENKVKSRN